MSLTWLLLTSKLKRIEYKFTWLLLLQFTDAFVSREIFFLSSPNWSRLRCILSLALLKMSMFGLKTYVCVSPSQQYDNGCSQTFVKHWPCRSQNALFILNNRLWKEKKKNIKSRQESTSHFSFLWYSNEFQVHWSQQKRKDKSDGIIHRIVSVFIR